MLSSASCRIIEGHLSEVEANALKHAQLDSELFLLDELQNSKELDLSTGCFKTARAVVETSHAPSLAEKLCQCHEPSQYDQKFRTLLHIFVSAGDEERFSRILEAGAEVALTDTHGWTALVSRTSLIMPRP